MKQKREFNSGLTWVVLACLLFWAAVLATCAGCVQAIFTKDPVEPHPGDAATVYAYKVKVNTFMTDIDFSHFWYRNVLGLENYTADTTPATVITPGAVIMTEQENDYE